MQSSGIVRLATLAVFLLAPHAIADVMLDGTLCSCPSGTPVPDEPFLDGRDFQIDQDLGQKSGRNLFHSFDVFDIGPNDRATFSAYDPFDNVIARVTGGASSKIDGILRSEIPGANLYLLNRSGVSFGQGAQLDVDGSFYVSTADSISFEGTAPDFSTGRIENPVLASAPPSAFGFLGEPGEPIGKIGFFGPSFFSVPDGETLSLIGGTIQVNGSAAEVTLGARSGRIQLASVGDAEIPVVPVDLAQLDLASLSDEQRSKLGKTGKTTVSERADLDTTRLDKPDSPQGSIVIRGGEIILKNSRILAGGDGGEASVAIDIQATDKISVTKGALLSALGPENHAPGRVELGTGHLEVSGNETEINSINLSPSVAGDIWIKAETVRVSDTGLIGTETRYSASDPTKKLERFGGNVILTAGTLEVDDDGRVQATSDGSGAGGDLKIYARNIIVSQGPKGKAPGQIAAVAFSGGDGGKIQVRSASLVLNEGGQISTTTEAAGNGGAIETAGNGGAIDILATEEIILTGVSGNSPAGIFAQSGREGETTATGDGGSVLVKTFGVLEVRDGATISTRTFGTGNAGTLDLSASERITVSGSAGAAPGSSILSAQGARGDGGDLKVTTDVLELLDGGQISASTNQAGTSGDVSITARQVLISGTDSPGNRSRVAAQTNAPGTGGDAGSLSITATERVGVLDQGQISVASKGSGNSGNLSITSQVLEVADAGEISARTSGSGNGGSITLTTTDEITLSRGAEVTAESTGDGDAGNITIDAGRRFSSSNSSVTTESQSAVGGKVTIHASELIYPLNSRIITSVKEGDGGGGDIEIDPRFVVVNNSDIIAGAFEGDGGKITISGDNVLISNDSDISAKSERGIDGIVQINSPDTTLIADLAALPSTFLDASALLKRRCGTRKTQRGGSFLVEGRRGTPDNPDRLRAAWYKRPNHLTFGPRVDEIARAAEGAQQRGDFEEAIVQWRDVLKGLEAAAPAEAETEILLQLAQAYEAVGDLTGALGVLERAHSELEPASNSRALATMRGLRGKLRSRAGEESRAFEDLDRAIETAGAASNRELLARLRLDRGNAFISGNKLDQGMAAYAEAERVASEIEEPLLLAMVRSNMAAASIAKTKYDEAEALLSQAQADITAISASREKIFTLLSVGRGYRQLSQAGVERREALRLRVAEIFTEAALLAERIGDGRATSYAWGYLGQLYEDESRFEEAIDLTRRAMIAAQAARAPESLYLWQWQIGRLQDARARVDDAIRAYRAAGETLSELRQHSALQAQSQRSFAQELPLEPVVNGLVSLLLEKAAATEDPNSYERLLREARNTLEDFKATELQDYFQDACVAGLRKAAPESVPGAVVVYPVLLPDRTELIVSLPDGLKSYLVPVGSDRLTQEVERLRRLLEKRTTNEYRRPAQNLYDWLIRPLEGDLEAVDAQALVFVPGGPLRSIPMAALYDSEAGQFLIEKYPLAVTPGLTLTDPRHIEATNLRLLKAGLTESVQGYPALLSAVTELEAIQELLGGTTLQDEAFVTAALEDELSSKAFGIVHIVSHGEFGGTPESTFLLTYNEKLRMAKLAELVGITEVREKPLELLTLSACQTAAGDDRAALGMAGVAVKAGARSTLATLWYIDDRASSQLIAEFYRQLTTPQTSRAVALQRAQLSLLQDRSYQHPAYWSPFLLIGSWL